MNRRPVPRNRSSRSTDSPQYYLTVYYQNVRGIRTKTNELFLNLSSCDYDIVVLTETWLHSTISNSEISTCYNIFRCDRSSATSNLVRGGGVLIAVKSSLSCRSVQVQDCENLEQAIVCIKLKCSSLYVCGIYLPPNSQTALYASHSSAIQQLCENSSEQDMIVVVGDFNLPRLTWERDDDINALLPSNASSEQEIVLVETMVASSLHQVNTFRNSTGRILDLAFVSEPDDVELLEPPTPLLKIDDHHKPLVLRVDTNIDLMQHASNPNLHETYDFRHCNFAELNATISSVDWTGLFHGKTTDETVCIFYEILHGILNEYVSRRRSRCHPFKHPWWTSELQHLRNVLRKARRRYFRTKTNENLENLRAIEAHYNECQNASFRSYILRMETTAKQDPSSFWNFVRNRRRSNRIPTDMTFENRTADSPETLADMFADFFENVHCSNSPTFSPDNLRQCPVFDLNCPLLEITSADVVSALKELDVSKGPGTDNLPPVFLKECSESLQKPLCAIFNKSLRDCTFPELWKTASIRPIFKSGSCHAIDNYRGISILCCVAKVFESLVHGALYTAAQPFISEYQHGFVKKRSTTTNLMTFTNFVSNAFRNKAQVDAIYFDFSKAFDRVPHDLAVAKLSHLGFPRWVTDWLHSYLTERKAFVCINGTQSRHFSITSGVPQGSVLGPLIFVLFVNDLCYRLKSEKVLFADDLKLYRTISSLVDCCALQTDANEIQLWCLENGMELNTKKCKCITFTRRSSSIQFEYAIGPDILERVESIRDLGVTIDSKLQFNDHISITTAKGFAALGFVRRCTHKFRDIYAMKTLYCSLVRSVLEYAVCVWSPHHTTQIIRMERVQRCFIRYALRQLPWSNPADLPDYGSRCALIALETLSSRRKNLQRLFIFDLLVGNINCPSLLENVSLYAPSRLLRDRDLLFVRFYRTCYGINNPLDKCIRAFNSVCALFDFHISKFVFKNRIRNLD